MSTRRSAVDVAALALLAGCVGLTLGCTRGAASRQPAGTIHASLPPGTAALVGESVIPVTFVAEVARVQGSQPQEALDRLIADALAAEGAHASGEDRAPSTAWMLVATEARSVAEHVRLVSLGAGPPTDAEVAELTRAYWRDVDLPEQVKVIHAVVVRPKDPSKNDAARALASELATRLSAAKSDDDFDAIARATRSGSLDPIHVDRLPAITQDGRAAEGDSTTSFDPTFARAAFALKKPGDTSGVVESPFGWHVIRLIERRPPKVVPLEERRAQFAPEIYARRAHAALGAILTARRQSTSVGIMPDADVLMATVSQSTP